MVLVVLVVVLLAAIAYPSTKSVTDRLTQPSATYELLGLLHQARWWSAAHSRTCCVRIFRTEGSWQVHVYSVTQDGTLEQLSADWATTEQAPAISHLVEQPQSDRTEEEWIVTFGPWGTEKDYTIFLLDNHRPGLRIEVRRPSGLAWLVAESSEETPGLPNPERMNDFWLHHYRDVSY